MTSPKCVTVKHSFIELQSTLNAGQDIASQGTLLVHACCLPLKAAPAAYLQSDSGLSPELPPLLILISRRSSFISSSLERLSSSVPTPCPVIACYFFFNLIRFYILLDADDHNPIALI